MSKGYEQFKKVDAELDKLLLYLEKLEEDYAEAVANVDKNFRQYKRYKEAYEKERIPVCPETQANGLGRAPSCVDLSTPTMTA